MIDRDKNPTWNWRMRWDDRYGLYADNNLEMYWYWCEGVLYCVRSKIGEGGRQLWQLWTAKSETWHVELPTDPELVFEEHAPMFKLHDVFELASRLAYRDKGKVNVRHTWPVISLEHSMSRAEHWQRSVASE